MILDTFSIEERTHLWEGRQRPLEFVFDRALQCLQYVIKPIRFLQKMFDARLLEVRLEFFLRETAGDNDFSILLFLFNLKQHVSAREFWQAHVEENDINGRLFPLVDPHRQLSIGGFQNFVPTLYEHFLKDR